MTQNVYEKSQPPTYKQQYICTHTHIRSTRFTAPSEWQIEMKKCIWATRMKVPSFPYVKLLIKHIFQLSHTQPVAKNGKSTNNKQNGSSIHKPNTIQVVFYEMKKNKKPSSDSWQRLSFHTIYCLTKQKRNSYLFYRKWAKAAAETATEYRTHIHTISHTTTTIFAICFVHYSMQSHKIIFIVKYTYKNGIIV